MTMDKAEDVAEHLLRRSETLAVAESATGGQLSSYLVDVAGASDWFDRGYVTYSNDAKRQELGVDDDVLQEHGAVSAEVVEEMAESTLENADVDWAVATSGVAGPTGGTTEKPVGTIYISVAHAGDDSFVRSQRHEFDGTRSRLKHRFAEAALEMLETEIVEVR